MDTAASAPAPAEPTGAADAFASLEQLRSAHAALLEAVPDSEEELTADHVGRIRAFLRRAAAAGRLIDTPADRKQAQGLLDYWSATLYSQAARRAGPERLPKDETVLAEFQAGTVDQVARAADDWFRRLPEADQALARRILLRLVRLRPDRREFRAVAVPRSELERLAPGEQLDAILEGLTGAGVIRIEPGEQREDDRVSLRYEAIARAWRPYADRLDQRLRFRDAASFWEASGRDRSTLIRDSLLDEAIDYQDRSELEDRYVAASRERERSQNWTYRGAVMILAAATTAAAVAAAVAWSQMVRANREERGAHEQQRRAEDAAGRATRAQSKAEEERQRADAAAQLATQREGEARRAAAALKAKFRLSYIATFTRTLAEIAAAGSDGERRLAIHRLEVLGEGQESDRDIARILGELTGVLARAKAGTATREDFRRIAVMALTVGRKFKADALTIQDQDLVGELNAQARLAYRTARFCAEQIVATLETQPYMAADAYLKEFWLLYWGELGIVEGQAVQAAMVDFGQILRRIEAQLESRLPDPKGLFSDQQMKRYQLQFLRAKIDTLRTEIPKRSDPGKLLGELMGQRAPEKEVAELRRVLQEELIPALDGELKRGITPENRPPSAD